MSEPSVACLIGLGLQHTLDYGFGRRLQQRSGNGLVLLSQFSRATIKPDFSVGYYRHPERPMLSVLLY